MPEVTELTAAQTATQEQQAQQEPYWKRCLVAFDIFCNVVLLRGREDETISAHSARAAEEGKTWGKVMCAWLNWFQADHGAKAVAGDAARAQAILKTEDNSGLIS